MKSNKQIGCAHKNIFRHRALAFLFASKPGEKALGKNKGTVRNKGWELPSESVKERSRKKAGTSSRMSRSALDN